MVIDIDSGKMIIRHDSSDIEGYCHPLHTTLPAQPLTVPDVDFDEWARTGYLQIAMCDPDYGHQAKII